MPANLCAYSSLSALAIPEIDTAFLLAIRSRREAGYPDRDDVDS